MDGWMSVCILFHHVWPKQGSMAVSHFMFWGTCFLDGKWKYPSKGGHPWGKTQLLYRRVKYRWENIAENMQNTRKVVLAYCLCLCSVWWYRLKHLDGEQDTLSVKAELILEEGHALRCLWKPKALFPRWRLALKQRPEPPREKRGRKQTGDEAKQRRKVRRRSKEKGRFREPLRCLWSQGAHWFCWVFLHWSRHMCASVWTADHHWPWVFKVVGGLGSAGCSLPGMLLGLAGAARSLCVWSGHCLRSQSKRLQRTQLRNSKCIRRKQSGSWAIQHCSHLGH